MIGITGGVEMTVHVRKITVSLPSDLVEYADSRGGREQTSRSQVIAEALAEARAREQARLAAAGYRFYAGEAVEFAEASTGAVAETLEPYLVEDDDHDG
jgi:metal-responsive CopG/Arc/MetJ family transcriptional regulator